MKSRVEETTPPNCCLAARKLHTDETAARGSESLHRRRSPFATLPAQPFVIETRSAPASLVATLRDFTFYVAPPGRSIRHPVRRSLGVGGSSFFILLLVLVCFVQFSSSARARSVLTSPDKSQRSAFGSIAPRKGRRQVKQNRHVLPDSPNDLTDGDDSLDASVEFSTRHDQETPWFSTTTLNTIALHEPGSVPAFLLPVQCFCNLREHTRERAPPDLT